MVRVRKRLDQDFIAITPFLWSLGRPNQFYVLLIHRWRSATISKFYSFPLAFGQPCTQSGLFFGGHGVVVLRRRVFAAGYIGHIARESFAERRGDVGEGGDEAGLVLREGQCIVSHDDTCVTRWPGTTADHRYAAHLDNRVGDLGRHGLKQNGRGSGLFH